MPNPTFETPFVDSQFLVTDLYAHVHEGIINPNPPLPAPINIIRVDQDWSLHVHWDTTGSLVSLLKGYWHVDLYLERMGPGADLKLPVGPPEGIDVALTPGAGTQHYNVFINVPPGSINVPDHPQNYKLVVTITYKFCRDGGFGLMSGFVEGPMIQLYRGV
jgi:hypothetical protein